MKWVDEPVLDTPYTPTVEFLDSLDIDFCVHGDDMAIGRRHRRVRAGEGGGADPHRQAHRGVSPPTSSAASSSSRATTTRRRSTRRSARRARKPSRPRAPRRAATVAAGRVAGRGGVRAGEHLELGRLAVSGDDAAADAILVGPQGGARRARSLRRRRLRPVPRRPRPRAVRGAAARRLPARRAPRRRDRQRAVRRQPPADVPARARALRARPRARRRSDPRRARHRHRRPVAHDDVALVSATPTPTIDTPARPPAAAAAIGTRRRAARALRRRRAAPLRLEEIVRRIVDNRAKYEQRNATREKKDSSTTGEGLHRGAREDVRSRILRRASRCALPHALHRAPGTFACYQPV